MKAGRRGLTIVEPSQIYPDMARNVGRASDIYQFRDIGLE
jgi:hypothetical protein